MIASTAARGGLSLNGTEPVKTFVQIKGVRKTLTLSRLAVSNLDRDHRKRENIRFPAICPSAVQDLWRGPLCAVPMLV